MSIADELGLPQRVGSVCLRSLIETDLDALYDLEADPDVKRYIGQLPQETRSTWVNKMRQNIGFTSHIVIADLNTNQFIGRASLGHYVTSLDPTHRELQIVIAKCRWGEVALFLLNAAFKVLDTETVFGVVHPNNQASKKLMVTLGFVNTGETVPKKSQDMDHETYQLIKNK